MGTTETLNDATLIAEDCLGIFLILLNNKDLSKIKIMHYILTYSDDPDSSLKVFIINHDRSFETK